eukprot:CAMPEP_0119324070 /NCGR_PEP_ID=MMETSP1333-20130426/62294_1 /TAXON_ID=418940 /ORGANISM="Scyphosphaera apsteinii, Strain RCC1455" /LENGTH=37 /DNA_ID= /DNA_START= /DNA_END= /DNA_ORIENTATION=
MEAQHEKDAQFQHAALTATPTHHNDLTNYPRRGPIER